MTKAKIAFHIHSRYSDGLFTVKRILKETKKNGFDFVAINDHNEIKGSLKAIELSDNYGLKVIPGIEISFISNKKFTDLLVYFYDKENMIKFFNQFLSSNRVLPTFDDTSELEQLIKKFNGVIVPPHPFSRKGVLSNKINLKFSSLETINANNKPFFNKLAIDYQIKNKLTAVSGDDLHQSFKVLGTYTIAKSKDPIDTKAVLDALDGKNSDIQFSIVNNFKKNKLLSPLKKVFSLFLYSKFLLKLFIVRVLLRKL